MFCHEVVSWKIPCCLPLSCMCSLVTWRIYICDFCLFIFLSTCTIFSYSSWSFYLFFPLSTSPSLHFASSLRAAQSASTQFSVSWEYFQSWRLGSGISPLSWLWSPPPSPPSLREFPAWRLRIRFLRESRALCSEVAAVVEVEEGQREEVRKEIRFHISSALLCLLGHPPPPPPPNNLETEWLSRGGKHAIQPSYSSSSSLSPSFFQPICCSAADK